MPIYVWNGSEYVRVDDGAGNIQVKNVVYDANKDGVIDNADTVDGKHASDFALAGHTHDDRYYTKSQLQTSGKAQVHWNNITNKPSTYPPSSHTHTRSQITDFFSAPFWNNIPDKPSFPQLVADITLSSSADSVTINNLDINTDKVYLLVMNIQRNGTYPGDIRVFPNDAGVSSDYYTQYLNVGGSSVSAGRSNTNSVFYLLDTAYAETAIVYTFIALDKLAGATGRPKLFSFGVFGVRAGEVQLQVRAVSTDIEMDNITSLAIYMGGECEFDTGSRFILYKLG